MAQFVSELLLIATILSSITISTSTSTTDISMINPMSNDSISTTMVIEEDTPFNPIFLACFGGGLCCLSITGTYIIIKYKECKQRQVDKMIKNLEENVTPKTDPKEPSNDEKKSDPEPENSTSIDIIVYNDDDNIPPHNKQSDTGIIYEDDGDLSTEKAKTETGGVTLTTNDTNIHNKSDQESDVHHGSDLVQNPRHTLNEIEMQGNIVKAVSVP